jgi:hypothetical protein
LNTKFSPVFRKQRHLLFEATQGRVLLEHIKPDDEFKNTTVKKIANAAKTDEKRIEQEVREELFKVETRGLDNLAELKNGEALRNELLKMITRVVDHLEALAQKEGGDATATIEALEDFSDVHLPLALDDLKEHRKIAAAPGDQPEPFGGDELIKVITRAVNKLVERGKQDGRKATATREALKTLADPINSALNELKKYEKIAPNADRPAGPPGSEIQDEGGAS